MNTSDILSCLLQDVHVSPYVIGVFPRDKLPTLKVLPAAIVANTDTSKGPGEHWIAMYIPSAGEPIYFDSFGLPPQLKVFLNYMGYPHTSNTMQLQGLFSSACGQYAVYALAMMCRGVSMKKIQDAFDRKNFAENDASVTDWVNRNYNMKTLVYNEKYLTKQICKVIKNVKINGKHVCFIHK